MEDRVPSLISKSKKSIKKYILKNYELTLMSNILLSYLKEGCYEQCKQN